MGSFNDAGWSEEAQRAKAERSRSDETGMWMQGRTESNAVTARPVLSEGETNSSEMLKASGIEPFPAVAEVTEDDVSAQPTRTSHTVDRNSTTPSFEQREKGEEDNTAETEEKSKKGEGEKKKKKKNKKNKTPAVQRQVGITVYHDHSYTIY